MRGGPEQKNCAAKSMLQNLCGKYLEFAVGAFTAPVLWCTARVDA